MTDIYLITLKLVYHRQRPTDHAVCTCLCFAKATDFLKRSWKSLFQQLILLNCVTQNVNLYGERVYMANAKQQTNKK